MNYDYRYEDVCRYVGMDVIESHLLEARPNMTVSPAFAALMPEEFVADLSLWMLNKFGATEPQIMKVGNALYIAPSLLRLLKAEIDEKFSKMSNDLIMGSLG